MKSLSNAVSASPALRRSVQGTQGVRRRPDRFRVGLEQEACPRWGGLHGARLGLALGSRWIVRSPWARKSSCLGMP